MQVRNPLANLRSVMRTRAKLAAGALGLTMAALGAGLMGTALPAYAEVTTNAYTIGAPSAAVGAVATSPSSVGESALTNFAVTFDLPVALSGPATTLSRSRPPPPWLRSRPTWTSSAARASKPARPEREG